MIEKKISIPGKTSDDPGMIKTAFATILITLLLAGCAAPTYDDGSPRDVSEMPWNTPASWEGSIGVPGLSGYE